MISISSNPSNEIFTFIEIGNLFNALSALEKCINYLLYYVIPDYTSDKESVSSLLTNYTDSCNALAILNKKSFIFPIEYDNVFKNYKIPQDESRFVFLRDRENYLFTMMTVLTSEYFRLYIQDVYWKYALNMVNTSVNSKSVRRKTNEDSTKPIFDIARIPSFQTQSPTSSGLPPIKSVYNENSPNRFPGSVSIKEHHSPMQRDQHYSNQTSDITSNSVKINNTSSIPQQHNQRPSQQQDVIRDYYHQQAVANEDFLLILFDDIGSKELNRLLDNNMKSFWSRQYFSLLRGVF